MIPLNPILTIIISFNSRITGDISKNMLTRELRVLEAQKTINKKIFAEIPPRVEYSLRKKGEIFFLFLKNLANGVVSILKIRAQSLKDIT